MTLGIVRAAVLQAVLLAVPVLAAVGADLSGQATVIDGDTIEIHGERVRLFGIDAPESGQSCYMANGQTWPCGRKAAFALADKIGRKQVTCRARDRDRYGRIVGVCNAAGEDLNGWLAAHGWAMAYRRYSMEYVPQEAVAREAKAGIWQGDFVEPWQWRREKR